MVARLAAPLLACVDARCVGGCELACEQADRI